MRLATETQDKKSSNPQSETESSHNYENRDHLSEHGEIESEKYFALVARATNDVVRDWNVKTGHLSWQGLESMLGHTTGAASREIRFWANQIHPGDRARTTASIRAALVADAENWTGEYRFRRADGSYADLLERALIIRDQHGAAKRFVGSLMDITARKQLQHQLCRSQKMEAFGQLAGGVAHDFNNFLTTILGYSDLLLGETNIKGANANHVGEIRKAARRASTLTAQLLAFSRKHPLEPRVLEVNSLLSNLERSLLRLLGENISVECHLHHAKESGYIKVDPGELTHIILNLVVNARDAMPEGGRLTLQTELVTIASDTVLEPACDDLAAGEYVLISVSDNGAGMSEEVKQHLFEPFFTTKDEGRGSGLGLATSYGIVRQSGGHISVASELGKGTIVRIYLSKVAAPPAPNYKKSGLKTLPTGDETILVLEDDVSVRHISVKVLRSLGYDVIEAANGDDAQRLIAQRNGRKVDLLLTDMVMPLMSGRDFANWLGKASPHTKVIFISGYLEESLLPAQRADREMFFLPKPFDPEQLARKVREAIDSAKITL